MSLGAAMHPGWRLPSSSSTLKLKQLLGRNWCCSFWSLLQPFLSHPTSIDKFCQKEGYRKYNCPKHGLIGLATLTPNSNHSTCIWMGANLAALSFMFFGLFWNHNFACCIYSIPAVGIHVAIPAVSCIFPAVVLHLFYLPRYVQLKHSLCKILVRQPLFSTNPAICQSEGVLYDPLRVWLKNGESRDLQNGLFVVQNHVIFWVNHSETCPWT